MPNIVKSLKGPKLNAQINPPASPISDETTVDFLRLHLFSSQKYVIDISLMDTVEVSDARKRSRKNNVDQIAPPGSLLNM